MPVGRRVLVPVLAGVVVASACTHTTRTIILDPAPAPAPAPGLSSQARASEANRGPSTAATLSIPPGHLPKAGECRVWIPGTPPGQQPKPKSRPCAGIAPLAPTGSWIVYRPTDDKRVVHIREVDSRRAGTVVRIRIFDIETHRLLREENP
jgi:hypothetical protein